MKGREDIFFTFLARDHNMIIKKTAKGIKLVEILWVLDTRVTANKVIDDFVGLFVDGITENDDAGSAEPDDVCDASSGGGY